MKKLITLLALAVVLVGCNADPTVSEGTQTTEQSVAQSTTEQTSTTDETSTTTETSQSEESVESTEAQSDAVSSEADSESAALAITDENEAVITDLLDQTANFPFDSAGSSLKITKLAVSWLEQTALLSNDIDTFRTLAEDKLASVDAQSYAQSLTRLDTAAQEILDGDANRLALVGDAGATLPTELPTADQWSQVSEVLHSFAK